jgi:hypothetical protein
VSILNIEKALKPNQHYRSDTARKPSKVANPFLGSPQTVLWPHASAKEWLGASNVTSQFQSPSGTACSLMTKVTEVTPPMF